MAAAASFEDICAVCLDTRPLKIVGRCKHRFCEECLTITLESQKGDVFACPTCKVDCPRPWDGVKGMVPFTGEDVEVTDCVVKLETGQRGGSAKKELQETDRGKAGAEPQSNEGRGVEKRKRAKGKVAGTRGRVDNECTICHRMKKEVKAVNFCVECGNLYICEECTKVHARNKATQRHVVVHLESETMCGHGCLLNSYCHDCGEAVCMVCVMIVHGEHTVEKLADVVDQKIAELKVILEKKEEKLERVRGRKNDLALLKLIAPVVDKQDILIKEIEDHAQICFEIIRKWKEDLKQQVKKSYKVINEIPVSFEKVSEVVKELQEPTERAEKLLTETEYDPEYLNKLIAMQEEMDALVDEEGDFEEEGYREQLHMLHLKQHSFSPEEIPESFGRLDCADKEHNAYYPKRYHKIFQKTLQVVPEDVFIPCTANLGQMFAVAHPTRIGEPSMAIDIYDLPHTLSTTIGIYEIPGMLKCALTNRVPPLYDMSSTPDGKLAVLSNGTRGTGCSVKLFDPDGGYISSSQDINVAEPVSLGVTLQHQYVILGRNKLGQRVITVADKGGIVQHTLKIDKDFIKKDSAKEEFKSNSDSDVESDEHSHEDTKGDSESEVMDQESFDESDSDVASDADDDSNTDTDSICAVDIPKRISCGGRFIFVTGDQTVVVYEFTHTGIHACKIIELTNCYKCTDITASVWDNFFVTDVDSGRVWLQKWVMGNVSKCEWNSRDWGHLFDAESGYKEPSRVSIRDGHAVVSHGKTIRVFKE